MEIQWAHESHLQIGIESVLIHSIFYSFKDKTHYFIILAALLLSGAFPIAFLRLDDINDNITPNVGHSKF